jgi:Trk K+ transport system NAD-binding subunit
MITNMQKTYAAKDFPWLSAGALFFFFSALVGFESGVMVTERPELASSGLLTKAYYSLSLFVVGGVDLGTPIGGPPFGRFLVWLSYFGSPVLAAWGLIGTLLKALAPQSWQLKRLKNHLIVVGDQELVTSYLRVLRQRNKKIKVVVVSSSCDQLLKDEFKQNFSAIAVNGDITNEFFLCELKVPRAKKILLLDDNSLRSYDAASVLIKFFPDMADKVIIHCASLRFMRSMERTRVANTCETFNSYHLAAAGLVRSHMLHHFKETRSKDVVIMAGFGRFGQTILEELQQCAAEELDTVLIIDQDAHRRVLVADEQTQFAGGYRREQFEGDISNPEIWDKIHSTVDIQGDNTVFVMGTGNEELNLRTALWLRRKHPWAMVISRSSKESLFAAEVGKEHNIINISIAELLEQNLPSSWVDF